MKWSPVLMATAAGLLTLAACGGDDDSSGVESTSASATTKAEASSPAATTTDAPTTTESTSTTSTTSPPTTTTIPAGSTISRDTALAANACFEAWHSLQWMGQGGQYFEADLGAMESACDEAAAQVDVDQIGAPTGPFPVNELASVIATINLQASISTVSDTLAGCPGGVCGPPEGRLDFLVLDNTFIGSAPPAFYGTPVFTPTVEDIEGLVVE